MITYLENKDITTVERGVIAHGVNCQGVMGSGVALAIRHKWPVVYDRYKSIPTGKTVLGTAQLVDIKGDDSLFVVNCFTQLFYGVGGKFADPKAIDSSLWDAYTWADYYHLDLYIPKIGAGSGGLDWETEVLPIIEHADSKWSRVNTYICCFG